MTEIGIQLDKNVPVPLYYQLKTAILDNIKSGTYEQGSMIPKEQDFCEILDISRTTVRQAITELVHEGWYTVLRVRVLLWQDPSLIRTSLSDWNLTTHRFPDFT